MASFNKSNWTRYEGSPAIAYSPQSQGFGIPASLIAANTTSVITYNAPRKFKGNGPCDVTIVMTTAANSPLQAGVSLGEAVLLGPASGSFGTSYAAGTLPKIQFKVVNSTTIGQTPTATDVIFTQF